MSLSLRHCYIVLNLQSIYNTEDRILWTGKKYCYIFGDPKDGVLKGKANSFSTLQTEIGIQKSMQIACRSLAGMKTTSENQQVIEQAKRLQLEYIV